MATTKQKDERKNIFVCLLIFLVLLGGTIVWLIKRSTTTDSKQVVKHLPVGQTEIESQPSKPEIENKEVTGEITDTDELTELENLPLPSPFDEEVHFTPYKPGSLIYHVDRYVEDELELAKQISNESFEETLLNTIGWNSNYSKLVVNTQASPAHPSSLKLIVYSRRFAKLVEHGREGLTGEERLGIVKQLKLDLARWRSLWADGWRIRTGIRTLHSVTKKSDELIIPVTYRINATMILVGAFSIEEALPVVIEGVDTLGVDTNWSAAGYACDKILTSLHSKELGAEERRILNEYDAWKTQQNTKVFEYEILELPSFKSARRPCERATSLGAALDLSEGTVSIEMPPQYSYWNMREGKGYHDLTGSAEVQRRAIDFAKAYSQARLQTTVQSTHIDSE